MRKGIRELSYISLLSMLTVACSGGDSGAKTVPTPIVNDPQFELSVNLSGLNNESVSFDWLGKSYTLDSNSQLSTTASSYTDPSNLVFPDTFNCASLVNKLTDLKYELVITCETKVNTEFVSISIENNLPYAVMIKLQDQIYRVETEAIETQISANFIPSITSTEGPLICDLLQSENNNAHWQLKCEEYLIATEKLTNDSEITVNLITKTNKIPIEINNLEKPDNLTVLSHLNNQFFLFGNWVYSLKFENGQFHSVQKSNISLTSFVSYNNTLYGLSTDGVYKFSNINEIWEKIRPITKPLASELFISGNTLSWLTKKNNSLVLDRLVSQINKPTTAANQEVIVASDHGAISLKNGTLWLARNSLNEWLLTAVEIVGNSVDQVIQILNENNQFALWHKSNEATELLMIEGSNILSFEIENQSMNWQPFKSTTSDLIAARGDLLITASKISESQGELDNIYKGKNALNQEQLINTLNLSSAPLISLKQDNTSFSNIELNAGFLLFYIEGDVWVTDGSVENSMKVLSNQTWQQFSMLSLIASGKTILLLQNDNKDLNTIITINF